MSDLESQGVEDSSDEHAELIRAVSITSQNDSPRKKCSDYSFCWRYITLIVSIVVIVWEIVSGVHCTDYKVLFAWGAACLTLPYEKLWYINTNTSINKCVRGMLCLICILAVVGFYFAICTLEHASESPTQSPTTLTPSVPPHTTTSTTLAPSNPFTQTPTTLQPSKFPTKTPITLAPSNSLTETPSTLAPSKHPTQAPSKPHTKPPTTSDSQKPRTKKPTTLSPTKSSTTQDECASTKSELEHCRDACGGACGVVGPILLILLGVVGLCYHREKKKSNAMFKLLSKINSDILAGLIRTDPPNRNVINVDMIDGEIHVILKNQTRKNLRGLPGYN
jgi:hypothetical protein